MKVIELLNKIAKGEIKEGTFFKRIGVCHSVNGKTIDKFEFVRDGFYRAHYTDGTNEPIAYNIQFLLGLNDEVEVWEEEKYDKYHQKGGDYVIPTEVFNDLLEEKQMLKVENDRLKKLPRKIKQYILTEMYVDREVVAGWMQFNKLLEMIGSGVDV